MNTKKNSEETPARITTSKRRFFLEKGETFETLISLQNVNADADE